MAMMAITPLGMVSRAASFEVYPRLYDQHFSYLERQKGENIPFYDSSLESTDSGIRNVDCGRNRTNQPSVRIFHGFKYLGGFDVLVLDTRGVSTKPLNGDDLFSVTQSGAHRIVGQKEDHEQP